MEDDILFVCDKCGAEFVDVIVLSYREYPGASLQQDYASPCCSTGYSEGE